MCSFFKNYIRKMHTWVVFDFVVIILFLILILFILIYVNKQVYIKFEKIFNEPKYIV